MRTQGVEKFFAYARERHQIYLKKRRGEPRPWTEDEILQKYRFTCVFREQDKTTRWFRENVRDRLRDRPEVLLATVVFRLLNRIETGEAMFCQPDLEGRTAFDKFLADGDARHLRRDIVGLIGRRGPYVTGAYIISSPPGLSKLDGMMKILQEFHRKSGWRDVAAKMLGTNSFGAQNCWSLQRAHEWFREQPWLGNFHSYEIVTDLRWTRLLEKAPDVMTWASVGPGARRGLNRVAGRDKKDKSLGAEQMLEEMRELLSCSRDARYWPQGGKRTAKDAKTELDWPKWEMRETEHTCCEYDKMCRVLNGEGRPRGVYR